MPPCGYRPRATPPPRIRKASHLWGNPKKQLTSLSITLKDHLALAYPHIFLRTQEGAYARVRTTPLSKTQVDLGIRTCSNFPLPPTIKHKHVFKSHHPKVPNTCQRTEPTTRLNRATGPTQWPQSAHVTCSPSCSRVGSPPPPHLCHFPADLLSLRQPFPSHHTYYSPVDPG